MFVAAGWAGEGDVTYRLSIPPDCAEARMHCGLIVDVHGATMTAVEQDLETNLRQLGEQAVGEHGARTPYVVLQPELRRAGYRWRPEDAALILTRVNSLIASLQLDPRRVHASGFSQGGIMSAWWFCQADTPFASFAMIAGGADELLECLQEDARALSRPVLYIHGRTDRLVPFVRAERFAQASVGASPTWPVEFVFHAQAGGVAKGHCVPGGAGRLGCGPLRRSDQDDDVATANVETAGERILRFFIDQAAASRR